jgi:hypothetical protein
MVFKLYSFQNIWITSVDFVLGFVIGEVTDIEIQRS